MLRANLRSACAAIVVGAIACDIVPTEPDDVHPEDLRHDPPALLARANGSALVVLALVVAVAAIVLGALGFLPATRMRTRELGEQLD